MTKITKIDKQVIKESCDLIDYVSTRTDLVNVTTSEKGHIVSACPSCGKKRSHVVYADGYYCHACGFSGDCIAYVQYHDGLNFQEALKQLHEQIMS